MTGAGEPFDAVVVGAGLGGLAAAITLGRAGQRVAVVRPLGVHATYGESLDWESNRLLAGLGVDLSALVQADQATWKRGAVASYAPSGEVMAIGFAWPYRALMSLVGRNQPTVHVDMVALRTQLERLAQTAGVVFLSDKVRAVRTEGDRITSLQLAEDDAPLAGQRYIDATGRARVLARALRVTYDAIGPRKVAFSARAAHAYDNLGTQIFLDDEEQHVRWAWGIHLGARRVDVGVALLASEVAALRKRRANLDDALLALAHRHARLRFLPHAWASAASAHACSYQDDVAARLHGANWWLVGEAAAVVDPILSGGVTFALRSGLAAARVLTTRAGHAVHMGPLGARLERKLRMHAGTTNSLVDQLWYRSRHREVGLRRSILSVLVPNFNLNHLHARAWTSTALGVRFMAALHAGLDWLIPRYARLTGGAPALLEPAGLASAASATSATSATSAASAAPGRMHTKQGQP